MLEKDLQDNRRIGELGATCMMQGVAPQGQVTVLTHCNTGALATAGYGTALGELGLDRVSLHQVKGAGLAWFQLSGLAASSPRGAQVSWFSALIANLGGGGWSRTQEPWLWPALATRPPSPLGAGRGSLGVLAPRPPTSGIDCQPASQAEPKHPDSYSLL